jgi:hypothetical protein
MKFSFCNISFSGSDFLCPALLPPSGRVTGEKSEHKTFSAKTQIFMIFNPPFSYTVKFQIIFKKYYIFAIGINS